jgi:hypothetical protein
MTKPIRMGNTRSDANPPEDEETLSMLADAIFTAASRLEFRKQ